jgi:group I intron endonuclease
MEELKTQEYPYMLNSGVNVFLSAENSEKISGIYGISGVLPSPSFQTPIYIGSAVDIFHRINDEHLLILNRDAHVNKPLQNYYNKYGKENLVVWCMEEVEPEKKILLKTEQKYIDYYGVAQDGRAFNIQPTAGNSMGVKLTEEHKRKISESLRKRIITEETRKKISKINKGRKFSEEHCRKISEHAKARVLSEETKKKLSIAFKGRIISPETHEKISKGTSRDFRLLSPSGEIFEGANLHKFAKEHGLTASALSQVLNGINPRFKQHKGWTKAPDKIN